MAHGTLGRAILAGLLGLPPGEEMRLSLPNDVAWRVDFAPAALGGPVEASAVVHRRDGVEHDGPLYTDAGGEARFELSSGN